jgi:hypothetical protein
MSTSTMPALTAPNRVKARILVEISVGTTSVMVDWSAARQLLDSLNTQMSETDVIRVSINCVATGSKVVNFPIYMSEARSLIETLDWFVNA